jgi:hypothetical protein
MLVRGVQLRYYRKSSGNGSATSFWFGSPSQATLALWPCCCVAAADEPPATVGACLLSLFLSDLLGALGWSMSLRWVLRNRQTAVSRGELFSYLYCADQEPFYISQSHACTFQGRSPDAPFWSWCWI